MCHGYLLTTHFQLHLSSVPFAYAKLDKDILWLNAMLHFTELIFKAGTIISHFPPHSKNVWGQI